MKRRARKTAGLPAMTEREAVQLAQLAQLDARLGEAERRVADLELAVLVLACLVMVTALALRAQRIDGVMHA